MRSKKKFCDRSRASFSRIKRRGSSKLTSGRILIFTVRKGHLELFETYLQEKCTCGIYCSDGVLHLSDSACNPRENSSLSRSLTSLCLCTRLRPSNFTETTSILKCVSGELASRTPAWPRCICDSSVTVRLAGVRDCVIFWLID